MRFLIFFLLFSTFALSHETKFPYDYFETEAIYHLDTGQIIYVEKYVHGYILWEKNATGRLNKLGSFAGFYGIAKECHAYKDNEFNNIVFASSKEYYYGGGINEFPIRMYHLYERNAHVSYRTDIGMVMDMGNTWCTFYEPVE